MATVKPSPAPETVADIKALLTPGTEVRTILRHVSKSGMYRRISLVIVDKGEIRDISYVAAHLLGYTVEGSDFSLRVSGAGMDMGFHLVYSLASRIHGDGYALTQRWL